MFQTKVVQKIKTHNCVEQLFSKNYAFYDIMFKNVVESDRLQVTLECSIEKMRFACRITKAITHTLTLIIFNTYCFIIN
jgi:hypothetical protein